MKKKLWVAFVLGTVTATSAFADDFEVKIDGFILPSYFFANE